LISKTKLFNDVLLFHKSKRIRTKNEGKEKLQKWRERKRENGSSHFQFADRLLDLGVARYSGTTQQRSSIWSHS
jgi:hypothetical protein